SRQPLQKTPWCWRITLTELCSAGHRLSTLAVERHPVCRRMRRLRRRQAGVRAPASSLTDRQVTVRGLQPETAYTFRIFALNGVSEVAMATKLAWKSVSLRTGAATPSKPSSITVKIESSASVRVSWSSSDTLGGGGATEYELKFGEQLDPTKSTSYYTAADEYLLTGLTQGVTYMLQIRARNSYGWGEFRRCCVNQHSHTFET
uniref:Fibronectin type-III domain-containing protein n=1 Tax=Macrostomum lignano TaxID=282301 RepID=A0A1I8FP59_9PLAT